MNDPYGHGAVDIFRPICPFELHGTCNDSSCKWQHFQARADPVATSQKSAQPKDELSKNKGVENITSAPQSVLDTVPTQRLSAISLADDEPEEAPMDENDTEGSENDEAEKDFLLLPQGKEEDEAECGAGEKKIEGTEEEYVEELDEEKIDYLLDVLMASLEYSEGREVQKTIEDVRYYRNQAEETLDSSLLLKWFNECTDASLLDWLTVRSKFIPTESNLETTFSATKGLLK